MVLLKVMNSGKYYFCIVFAYIHRKFYPYEGIGSI